MRSSEEGRWRWEGAETGGSSGLSQHIRKHLHVHWYLFSDPVRTFRRGSRLLCWPSMAGSVFPWACSCLQLCFTKCVCAGVCTNLCMCSHFLNLTSNVFISVGTICVCDCNSLSISARVCVYPRKQTGPTSKPNFWLFSPKSEILMSRRGSCSTWGVLTSSTVLS